MCRWSQCSHAARRFFCGDLWGFWSSLRSWCFASEAFSRTGAVDVTDVARLAGAVLPVGSGSGADLPLWKRKAIVLVALDLAPVVQLYGVGPSLCRTGWDTPTTIRSRCSCSSGGKASEPSSSPGLYMTGDYTAAAASHEQALDLYRSLGHANGEATALSGLGLVQWAGADYRQASTNLGEALELSRRVGNKIGEANALNYLGSVQYSMGNYAGAAASQERALQLYRELGSRHGEANALNDLGNIQRATADYVAAAGNLIQALALYQQVGDQVGEAEALNNMGALKLSAGTFADARACHERALAITAGVSPLEEAQALEGLGRCDLRNGQVEQGKALLHQALVIYKQIRSLNSHQVEITLREHEGS